MFSHNFSYYFSFPIFWELYGFLLHVNLQQTFDLGMFCFPILSRTIGIRFPHVSGTILLMWKLIKKNCFRSHFYSKVYVELFTKEINLFYCWARSIICISDPLATKLWIYIQYRREDSVSNFAIFLWVWQLKIVWK